MDEWLLLPAVQAVVGKMVDAVIQRLTSIGGGVEDDRRKLEDRLVYVRPLLADAERKAEAKTEAGRAIKRWMKRLKAVSYQAEDVLDRFHYEDLRRQAEGGDSADTSRKVMFFLGKRKRQLSWDGESKDLNAVLTKIDELVKEMNKFGLREIPEVPSVVYRETHSAPDEYTVGRDGDRDVVVKLLLDQQDQKDVQVLPIIGMGGLGKTTLAKMVYNDDSVQKHFELKMWHCVSENFEATTIIKSVIKLAGGRDSSDNTIELLRGQLQEVIGRKRYLLILDDVWNEEQQKWEDCLKPLLCSSIGGSGSMIVVTSRMAQVASIMGTLPTLELACLSGDDPWKLFSKRAFSKGVEMQPEFVTIGKLIVSKCKGLPLALKTMGGLMSSMHQVRDWKTIATSNIGDTTSGKGILDILKLSYRHLSPELKQCFAFCAIFPKDFMMEKDKLIELWLANGFIHDEGTMESMAQRAESVFNELAWRSFLEDVKVREFYYPARYNAVGCKMHDLVHDVAKDVTDECAFATELNQGTIKDVRHMQVSSPEMETISGLLKEASSLHTLLIGGWDDDFKELKLASLRALQCIDPSIIHGHLIHLRYLDLSGSDIAELPNEVSIMYNLLSLRLNDCTNLRYLPDSVTALMKLIYLYLFECRKLERMPQKLSLLKNLRILTTFIVGTEDGYGIEELRGLGQHGHRLELYNLRNVKSGSKADLHERKNLSELLLDWNNHTKFSSANDEASNAEEVLESLAPHGELQILKVRGYGGQAIPRWMKDPGMFQCLKKLSMSYCARCKELPTVWLSSSLEELWLDKMDSLTTLCKNIDVEAEGYNAPLLIFPKLKIMSLRYLPQLERWAENSAGEPIRSVEFPMLKRLHFIGCGKPTSLVKCPVLVQLNHQTEVVANVVMPLEDQPSQRQRPLYTTLPGLTGDGGHESIFNVSESQRELGACFPLLEELEFIGCHDIICWPVKELRCLRHLRSLSFDSCSKLEGNGSLYDGFLSLTQLETLNIFSSDSLLEIPMLPSSLEEMTIEDCPSLVALPSNLGNLAKLRDLRLRGCGGLKALPDEMGSLTSLEKLTIARCPEIKKFPSGLLQRLPTLKFLAMIGCPELQRRCREAGEYFDLVSSIPDRHVPAAEAEIE